jgi:flagellin
MSMSILNNISALTAENNLNATQASLQNTLTQLSSGSRINSGSDDAAGLSIANGLQANIAALSQSVQNATNGTGLLQTADGALSQVTTLLNRGVTLATEASTSGITNSGSNNQATALDTEYQSILTEINSIGSDTNFNGSAVFGSNGGGNAGLQVFMSDGTTSGDSSVTANIGALSSSHLGLGAAQSFGQATLSGIANPVAGDALTIGAQTYTFDSSANMSTDAANNVAIGATMADTLQNLANAINGTGTAGVTESTGTTSAPGVSATNVTPTSITIQATDVADNADAVSFTPVGGATNLGFSSATLTGGAAAGSNLLTASSAQSALTALTAAISQVAADRGTIGASVNQLTAASNVMNSQIQNLTSASSGITDADIGTTVANMSKYNTLEQTGISALQQANQASQTILKLLQ